MIEIPNEYLNIERTTSDEYTWYYFCRKCFHKNGLMDFDETATIDINEYPLKETEQMFKNGIKNVRLECGRCGNWLGWKETPPQNYIMRFGKHKGKFLKDIPRNYLLWLEARDICNEPLKSKILELLYD